MCRDLDCLERPEQNGVSSIEKGSLRIGRRVLIEKGDSSEMTIMWYHARCIFNTFLRARPGTRVILSEDDIEGFHFIDPADQDMLRRFIANNDEVRGWRGRGSAGGGGGGGGGGGAAAAAARMTPE